MKKNIKLLVTCVGGDLSPELLKQIKKSKVYNYTIIGVDTNNKIVGKYFCDKFYQITSGENHSKFIDDIVKIIDEEKVDFVLPSSDEEAVALSLNKRSIEKKGCVVFTDYFNKIDILNDKLKTYTHLKKKKLDNFFWKSVKNYDEILKTIKKKKNIESFVLKTSNDRGSRNIFYINNYKFFDFEKNRITKTVFKKCIKNINNSVPFILMETFKPPVFDIDILTWKGKLLKIVQRKRINSDNPNLGHEIVSDKKILKLCSQLTNEFDLTWIYDCDVMFNKFDEPCLLEINPRKSGSLTISLMAKINLIDDLVSLVLKKKTIRSKTIKKGIFVPYKSMIHIK